MINVKYISIRNFMGIEKFSIDVEKIGYSSLIFILGHNGAGKSSILEAILFALTSRAGRVQGKKQILRQGTTEGFVLLQFYGIDGQLYQVKRIFYRDRNSRSYLRVRSGDRWIPLDGVPDMDKSVNSAIQKILGVEGKLTDILKSTFLIMQGSIDDMVVGKNPLEILSRSGVLPFKEEDIKKIIKEKIDDVKMKLEYLDNSVVADRRLIHDTYDKIRPFIEAYDSILANRWEDIADNGNDSMLLSLLEDTLRVIDKSIHRLQSFLPAFQAYVELEQVEEEEKKLAQDIEDVEKKVEEMNGRREELIKNVRQKEEYLAKVGIDAQAIWAVEYLKGLKDRGFPHEYIVTLGRMRVIPISTYKEVYEELRINSPAIRRKNRIYSVYLYLHKTFQHYTEADLKRLKEIVDRKRRLENTLTLLKKEIEAMKSRLIKIKKDIGDINLKLTGHEEELNQLAEEYEKAKPFVPYIPQLSRLIYLIKDVKRLNEEISSFEYPDISGLERTLEEYETTREKISVLKAKLEDIPDQHRFLTNKDVVEKWVIEYGRFMHSRDGRCPVCGSVHTVKPHNMPPVTVDLIDSLYGLQADYAETKRREIYRELEQLYPGSKDIDDALIKIKRDIDRARRDLERAKMQVYDYEKNLRELGRLKKEIAGIRTQLNNVDLPEDISQQWLEKIQGIVDRYEDLLKTVQALRQMLQNREKDYNDLHEDLTAKMEEVKKVEEELSTIPHDVEERLHQLEVYFHLKDESRYLLRRDVEPTEYYEGFEKDARRLVAYKRAYNRLYDLIGKEYLELIVKEKRSIPTVAEISEVNKYIEGIKSNAANIVFGDNFERVYQYVEEILAVMKSKKVLEEELEDVDNKIIHYKGQLKTMKDRLGKLMERKHLLLDRAESIPNDLKHAVDMSGMQPEILLDRLIGARHSFKSLKEHFALHLKRYHDAVLRKYLLEYVRRNIVPKFYKWYVDKVMYMFRNRLSDNLQMISGGRYRLESMKGDKGIVVYDTWDNVTRHASLLSGGEKTMLGLSFIFALADIVTGYGGRRVFFIDEAFSSLDRDRKQSLKPVLESLISATGHTIFIITHDESILSTAPPESPVIVMERGKIKGDISTVGMKLGTSFLDEKSDSLMEEDFLKDFLE